MRDACLRGDVDAVRALIAREPEIVNRPKPGRTGNAPLMYAASRIEGKSLDREVELAQVCWTMVVM